MVSPIYGEGVHDVLEGISPSLLDLTGPAALTLIALLVITDKLIWHKRLHQAESDRDYWRGMALRSLGVAEKMTVHAEVANEVLSHLPEPPPDKEPGVRQ